MDPTLQPVPADAGTKADPEMPDGTPRPTRKPLGELLVEAGLIDLAQLDQALRDGAQTGERIGEVVVRRRWTTEDDVARVLADQWGLSYVDRASIFFDADALARLSREDAQRLEALPTRVQDGRVVVAVAEPTEQRLAALEQLIGDTVVVVVPKSALEAGLHSELLSSRSGAALAAPVQEDVSPPEPPPQPPPPEPLPSDPHPEPVQDDGSPPEPPLQPPRPEPLPSDPQPLPRLPLEAPAAGLQGVAALAAQARGLADLMAAQAAAVTTELSEGRMEELTASRRRVKELESELAAQRVAVEELKRHLQAALRALDRDF